MRNITTYITEKLHLNKDLEVENESLLDVICNSTGLSNSKYNDVPINTIKNWIEDNDIDDVGFYCKQKTLDKIPRKYQDLYNCNNKYYQWIESIIFNDNSSKLLYDNSKIKDRLTIVGNEYYITIDDHKRNLNVIIIDKNHKLKE